MMGKIKLIYFKGRKRLNGYINQLWRYLPVKKLSIVGLRGNNNLSDLKTQLNRVVGELQDGVFLTCTEEEKENIIKWANHTLHHDFDYLGSGLTHLEPISWHSDFKHGYTWQKGMYYRDINVDLATDKYDGKTPWELSRCHHLLWLGGAYRITKNEKYAVEIVSEIHDWFQENPLMYTVNWVCAMDVAIRAVNWMYAIWLIQDSSAITADFVAVFNRSLYQHGFFIYHNLEKSIPYSNNHYTSNLVGLLYLGAWFEKKKWYSYSKKELLSDIRLQILPSGVQYERSVSYHRLGTEMLLASYYLMRRMGEIIPIDVEESLQKMLTFVAAYLKPNGLAPLIEDNDDGRFLPIVRRDFRNHSYLLDQNSLENKVLSNGLLLLKPYAGTVSFADAGHWIYRKGEAYLFVTNGGQSRKPTSAKVVGTHTHNDLLSFELALGEDDVIVDPGTYHYLFTKPEGRNEFRSTRKHNTLMVDGEEQHGLSDNKLFLIEKNAIIDSNHSYHTKSGLKHSRFFKQEENVLTITDNIEKTGNDHHLELFLHFAPGVKTSLNDKCLCFETNQYIGNVRFIVESSYKIEIKDDTVSPSYGVLMRSKMVLLVLDFSHSAVINTVFNWEKR